MADIFSNSKSKAENSAEAIVLADSGEVEEVEIADEGGEDGPNAVLRRRREFLGWSGWNLEGILRRLFLGVCFVIVVVELSKVASWKCEADIVSRP